MGEYKKAQGSGFFIFSGQGVTLALTAAHLVDQAETLQSSNPDWKVENGVIKRKISLFLV